METVKNIKYAIKIIQKALQIIKQWAEEWSFKISPDKTQVILFNAGGDGHQKITKTHTQRQTTRIRQTSKMFRHDI